MDGKRFDALTRALVVTPTRRGLSSTVLAVLLGQVLGLGRHGARAANCPSGTYKCGGNPDAECCQIGLQCCQQTGLCCAPGETCFRTIDGDLCKPDCGPNARRCAAGEGECCPDGQECCGNRFRTCCGPDDYCERVQSNCGNQPAPCCRRRCPLGQIRCAAGAGECCTLVLQHCCGPVCCGPNEECKVIAGEHRCEELCLPGTRRCGGSGPCCPNDRKCCNGRCCAPGQHCRRRGHRGRARCR